MQEVPWFVEMRHSEERLSKKATHALRALSNSLSIQSKAYEEGSARSGSGAKDRETDGDESRDTPGGFP